MPYIADKSKRFVIRQKVHALNLLLTNWGDLNYAITKLVMHRWRNNRRYTTIVGVMGTLLCVALEFYRRVAAPYEDEKKEENGDVY